MAVFSFSFTEGSFLLLNCQKHLRSVAEDLTSHKHKRTKRIYQKLSSQYFSTGLISTRRVKIISHDEDVIPVTVILIGIGTFDLHQERIKPGE